MEHLIFFMIVAYRKKPTFEKRPKKDPLFFLLFYMLSYLYGVVAAMRPAGLDKAAVQKMGEQKDGKILGC